MSENIHTHEGPSATERLMEQGRTVRDDVKELGSLAREAASEKFDEARDRAGTYARDKKRRAGELEDELMDWIRERPLRSVLVAAGAGAILGMFLSRR